MMTQRARKERGEGAGGTMRRAAHRARYWMRMDRPTESAAWLSSLEGGEETSGSLDGMTRPMSSERRGWAAAGERVTVTARQFVAAEDGELSWSGLLDPEAPRLGLSHCARSHSRSPSSRLVCACMCSTEPAAEQAAEDSKPGKEARAEPFGLSTADEVEEEVEASISVREGICSDTPDAEADIDALAAAPATAAAAAGPASSPP